MKPRNDIGGTHFISISRLALEELRCFFISLCALEEAAAPFPDELIALGGRLAMTRRNVYPQKSTSRHLAVIGNVLLDIVRDQVRMVSLARNAKL